MLTGLCLGPIAGCARLRAAFKAAGGASEPYVTAPQPIVASTTVIVSRIAGTFEGWSGNTLFRLENGQLWEQASYDYRFHYAYRPRVTIVRCSRGYRMLVDGFDETILVRRIR